MQEKLERRIRSVDVKVLNPPRPGVLCCLRVLVPVGACARKHVPVHLCLRAWRSLQHTHLHLPPCCRACARGNATRNTHLAPRTTHHAGKKCLVLDIDYTLFDLNSSAEHPDELARPYLHEFLTACYEHYDIIIWSATNMKWVEVRARRRGCVGCPPPPWHTPRACLAHAHACARRQAGAATCLAITECACACACACVPRR